VKITVEFSDSALKEIRKATGEKKKGPAIKKLVEDALRMRRRRELAQKFISGELGVELNGFEDGQKKDKEADEERARRWRE
jgi:hypothetical protein